MSNCSNRHSILTQAMAMAVVCLFLANDIVRAYPDSVSQNSTLARWSAVQVLSDNNIDDPMKVMLEAVAGVELLATGKPTRVVNSILIKSAYAVGALSKTEFLEGVQKTDGLIRARFKIIGEGNIIFEISSENGLIKISQVALLKETAGAAIAKTPLPTMPQPAKHILARSSSGTYDNDTTAGKVNYWIDRVSYRDDKDLYRQSLDRLRYPQTDDGPIVSMLDIQNNRHISRCGRCSGGCYFCLSQTAPVQARLKETKQIGLNDTNLIVKQAIAMGFQTIQLAGEDSLDDMDSFWTIVDACHDNPIKFVVFTHGFSLIKEHERSIEFFRQLRARMGDVKAFSLVLSFDTEKMKRLLYDFGGDERLVYRAIAEVIHNFNEVFQVKSEPLPSDTKHKISVAARDMGSGSFAANQRRYRIFIGRLRNELKNTFQDDRGFDFSDEVGFFIATPEGVSGAIERGLMYQQYNTGKLFELLALRGGVGPCVYNPYLDMGTAELMTCLLRHEYPRRAVSPQTFLETLLKPLSNPRSRRLYLGEPENRSKEALKQLAFALALEPAIQKEMQVKYEEVESFIFSHEKLMLGVELLYLLEDVIDVYGNSGQLAKIERLPRGLIGVLLDDKILSAYLRYRLLYYPKIYKNRDVDFVQHHVDEFSRNPNAAIKAFRQWFENDVFAKLDRERIIAEDEVPVVSAQALGRSADTGAWGHLPIAEGLTDDLVRRVAVAMQSADRSKRIDGLNALGTLMHGRCSWETVSGLFERYLRPELLDPDEASEVIDNIEEWFSRRKVSDSDVLVVLAIVESFFGHSSEEVSYKALGLVLHLMRNHQILPEQSVLWRQVPEIIAKKPWRSIILENVTLLRLLREALDKHTIEESEAQDVLAQMDVTITAHGLIDEIDAWEENMAGLFIPVLKRMLYDKKLKSGAKFAVRVLGKTREGKKVLAEYLLNVNPESVRPIIFRSMKKEIEEILGRSNLHGKTPDAASMKSVPIISGKDINLAESGFLPEREQKILFAENKNEKELFVKSAKYLELYPVNMRIDLTPIPGQKNQLEQNMKTLACLIAWHNTLGFNIRYFFENDSRDEKALGVLRGKIAELAKIPGINTKKLLSRIGTPHVGDNVIEIVLRSIENVKAMKQVGDREFVIALKDDLTKEGISIPNYTAASAIGLSLASLQIARETKSEEYGRLKDKVFRVIKSIYERYNIITEENGFTLDDLEFMVTGCPENKLYYAILYALPPIARDLVERIGRYHETLHLLLQSA